MPLILRRIFRIITFLLACLMVLIFIADKYIDSYAEYTYELSEIDRVPDGYVGLVLGTAKYVRKSQVNLYYQYRIDATVELFQAGVIDDVIVSGDNSSNYYNEPQTMKNDLIAKGISEDQITLDYAGFRTFDSVIRAKKIFGVDSLLLISQKFHNARAIFIAEEFGIHAIGLNAQSVPSKFDLKTYVREKLARVKVILDVYILNTQPRYLGKQIDINR